MDASRIRKIDRFLRNATGKEWEGDRKRTTRLQVTDQAGDIISYNGPRGYRAETAAAARLLAEAYVAAGAVTLRNSTLSYESMRSDRAVTVSARVLETLRRRDPGLTKKPLGDIDSVEFSGLAKTGLVEPRTSQPKQAVLSDEACDAIRLLVAFLRANRR